MKYSEPAGAIGTKKAVSIYEAEVLAQNIQGSPLNLTRFVVLSLSNHPPTGYDKTSLCFSFAEDRPGLFYGVLRRFTKRNIIWQR